MEDTFFLSQPKDKNGIIRHQTFNLRSWLIPRTGSAINAFLSELKNEKFPSNYVLFEGDKKKVYIGETESIVSRLKEHNDQPRDRIDCWEKALIINDGRFASQSDFNDTSVRHCLEHYLKDLFSYNNYKVVSAARVQPLTATQNSIFERLKSDIDLMLLRLNFVDRFLDKPEEREIFSDELKQLLTDRGFRIDKWGAYEATIGGEPYFIRPGSKKQKGWQITSRGRKPGSFIDCLIKGSGKLIVNRGKVVILPLNVINSLLNAQADSDDRDTFDIFFTFEDGVIMLKYHDESLNVTPYKLLD